MINAWVGWVGLLNPSPNVLWYVPVPIPLVPELDSSTNANTIKFVGGAYEDVLKLGGNCS